MFLFQEECGYAAVKYYKEQHGKSGDQLAEHHFFPPLFVGAVSQHNGTAGGKR